MLSHVQQGYEDRIAQLNDELDEVKRSQCNDCRDELVKELDQAKHARHIERLEQQLAAKIDKLDKGLDAATDMVTELEAQVEVLKTKGDWLRRRHGEQVESLKAENAKLRKQHEADLEAYRYCLPYPPAEKGCGGVVFDTADTDEGGGSDGG